MSKLNKLFFILAAGICCSSTVSARVCFLAGTDDDTACLVAMPAFESQLCLGYEFCEIPANGAGVCKDNDNSYYRQEDCCSNTNIYERCDGPGQYCNSTISCTGKTDEDEDYKACAIGRCACLASYDKECLADNGLVGDGEACNGKFESCKCDSGKFSVCDKGATCSGACELDSSQCASCTCPAADGEDWVTDPANCCAGSDYSCTNKTNAKSGTTVYHCKTFYPPENCTCSDSYSKGNCVTSCSDSTYSYKGKKQFVTCEYSTSFINDVNSICGNNCHCVNGYFDFTHTCTAQNASVCADLGYNSTSCEGDWLACPFDPSAKKCLGNPPKDECPAGYSESLISVANCGMEGSRGWIFESKIAGSTVCGRCTARQCPAVSISTGSGSGSGETVQSTTDSNAENCGTTGTSGWSTRVTAYYSGDKKCYVCEAKSCPSGYKVIFSEKSCGSSGSKGWTIEYSASAAGNNLCGKCVAKDCSSGKNEMSYGSSHPYVTFVPDGQYTGNTQCGTFEFDKMAYCDALYDEIKRTCGEDNLNYCLSHSSDDRCDSFKSCVYLVEGSYETSYFKDFINGNACLTCWDWRGSSKKYTAMVCPSEFF